MTARKTNAIRPWRPGNCRSRINATLDSLAGLGTGKLREHFDIIVKAGGRFYLSGMSSSARGVTAADLQGKPAELAPPTVLLRLALEHDRMFTY